MTTDMKKLEMGLELAGRYSRSVEETFESWLTETLNDYMFFEGRMNGEVYPIEAFVLRRIRTGYLHWIDHHSPLLVSVVRDGTWGVEGSLIQVLMILKKLYEGDKWP